MEKLIIVIPAHNEERRIGQTLREYLDFFKKVKTISVEIIVVLNACSDRTKEVVQKYKCKELKILEFKRGGKGFAVLEGFKEALRSKSDIIGFVDADMATTPADYYRLYKSLGNSDGVIADRYIKGAVLNPEPTLQRRIVSRMYNAVIRAMFMLPYRDTQCGAKLFKRLAVESIISKIGMTKWAFDVELIYKMTKSGFHIKPVATTWSDKEYSTVNVLSAGPMMVLGIVRLRILHSPFRRAIRVYDFLAESIRKTVKK